MSIFFFLASEELTSKQCLADKAKFSVYQMICLGSGWFSVSFFKRKLENWHRSEKETHVSHALNTEKNHQVFFIIIDSLCALINHIEWLRSSHSTGEMLVMPHSIPLSSRWHCHISISRHSVHQPTEPADYPCLYFLSVFIPPDGLALSI